MRIARYKSKGKIIFVRT